MKYEEFRAMQDGVIKGFREGCEALVAPGDMSEDCIRHAFNTLRSLLLERERTIENVTDAQRIAILNANKGFIKTYWHYLRIARGVGEIRRKYERK